MTIKLTIPGKPLGKQSVKVGKFGGFNRPETKNYLARVQSIFAGSYPGFTPLASAVQLTITAYFPIPKSTSKKKREEMSCGIIRPTIKRNDWDNIGKIIGDGLNQIAYVDDCQIVDGRVIKFYSDRPRVEITIEEI